ncbi:hypothetical protein TWF696_007243 [Orbilia brochopaga]|uniref:Uncharacterized protein n=1 Tax=Orbilia brochopaga TaxID=3140254 RepID=A0AAV9UY36_9PEZI
MPLSESVISRNEVSVALLVRQHAAEREEILFQIQQLALKQGFIVDGKPSPELNALEGRLDALDLKYKKMGLKMAER